MKNPQSLDNRERVLLVGVGLKKAMRGHAGDPSAAGRDSLLELEELAESAGAKIAGSIMQVREALDPATLVGPRQNSTKSARKPKRATCRW